MDRVSVTIDNMKFKNFDEFWLESTKNKSIGKSEARKIWNTCKNQVLNILNESLIYDDGSFSRRSIKDVNPLSLISKIEKL